MAKKHCKLQIFIAIFIVKLEHFLSEFIITKYEHKYFKFTYSFREQGYHVNLFPRYKHMFIIQKNSCDALLFLEMKEGTPYIKLHFVPFDI